MATQDSDSMMQRAPAKPRQGMAITSLVLGIVGFFTCGVAVVGAIVGIVLGIMALSRARKDPQQYAGRELAIVGIIVNGLCLLLGPVIAAIAIPNMLKSQQVAHEAAAIETVKQIANAETLYSTTRGQGHYANLDQLVSEGFIEGSLASVEARGYRFTSTAIEIAGMKSMFDVTARPLSAGTFGTGNRSFGSNETFILYQADGDVELKGTPANRRPSNGTPLQ